MKKLTCFKAYDIRGKLGEELNEDIAWRIGRAYGEFLKPKTIVLGGDVRLTSDYGFSYGAGLQFNPMENVALDFSYEQSRIRSVDVGTWIAGVGYRF